MPWKCKHVSLKRVQEKRKNKEKIPIGWIWFDDFGIDFKKHDFEDPKSRFSSAYEGCVLGSNPRKPIVVQLPNGPWCVDTKSSTGGFWLVDGPINKLTVHPSINSEPGREDGYHGWLQNGIISDDIDGRDYE